MSQYEEIKLFRLPSERENYDNLADCYSVMNTIQHLEKAYIKDAITSKEYTAACSKLLCQYRAAFKQIDKQFSSCEQFLRKYRFECPAALERIRDDRPITIKDDKGNTHACIADIVAGFITILDKLRLGIKSMDDLLPDVRELHELMGRLTIIPTSYEGTKRVNNWIEVMSRMSASDDLDETQVRQMTFDLDTSFQEFNKMLRETIDK